MKLLLACVMFFITDIVLATNVDLMQVDPNSKQFIIQLASNPTTGFQWSVVRYDHKLLSLSNSQFQKSNTNRIGAGGQMLFTFHVKKVKKLPACTTIGFKNARTWEDTGGSTKTIKICFHKD
ncbi:MAG: protease inhibitor I42 family protein [Legionella sp.]|nr:protease inhibitor I42 family protein [Legionella sp.]